MDLHHVQTVSEKITLGTTAAAGSSTVLMDWFNMNAAGIGAICTIISCVVYISIALYNCRRQK